MTIFVYDYDAVVGKGFFHGYTAIVFIMILVCEELSSLKLLCTLVCCFNMWFVALNLYQYRLLLACACLLTLTEPEPGVKFTHSSFDIYARLAQNHALSGIAVSLVMKYADNIVKVSSPISSDYPVA